MAEGKQVVVDLTFNANADNAKKAMKSLMQELNTLSSTTLKNAGAGTLNKDLLTASKTAIQLRQNLETAFNVKTGNLDLVKFNQSMKSAGMSLEQYRTQLMNLGPAGAQSFAQLSMAIMQADAPLARVNSKLNDFAVSLKNTAKWQISSSILHGLIGSINSAYSYAQNLNASLNDIRIVTGASADEMSKFATAANKAAKSLSTSTKTYADAALIFYQQGLGDKDVKERTDAVIKMANVTKDSAAEVSSYMTAIWNNFDDGSKSLEHYADVMTALGAATASSTAEIADGLEKFASIGKTIGLSYDYATSALATIVSQTRQSADTVGTGLRTIFSRLQGLSLGETLEDGVNLNKYSQALNSVGVQILDASGNMKDMDAILDSLAGKWTSLSQAQKTALAQTVGGVRQYTTLISLMDNWDSMETNLATAKGSSGALQEQADIYAESWDAAKDRVRASAEAIYSSLINDKFFISLNNGFSGFLDQINNLIDGLGGLKGVLLTLTPIVTKLFRDQITSGLRNTIVSLQALTPNGKKKLAETKQDAIEQTARMYEGSATPSGYAMADQYRRTSRVQQAYLDNQRSMSDENRRMAQESVARYNEVFGERVRAAGERVDQSQQAQSEVARASQIARRKALRKKDSTEGRKEIEEKRAAERARLNAEIDAAEQAELEKDYVKYKDGESKTKRNEKTRKQEKIREKYRKQRQEIDERVKEAVPDAAGHEKKYQAAEGDLIKAARAQGFQEKAEQIIKAKVDVDTEDVATAKKELQALIDTIRATATEQGIDLDTTGFEAALSDLEKKAQDTDASLQDLRDTAASLENAVGLSMDATDVAQNGSEEEDGPEGFERVAMDAGMDADTTKKVSQGLVDSGAQEGADILEIAVASREAEQAAQDLEGELNNLGNVKVDFASGFTASVSAISAVGAAVSQVSGLMDVWSDKSASVGEKVLTTVMTLASVAGSLGSAFDKSNISILRSMATTLAAKLGWFGLSSSMLSTAAAAPVAGGASAAAGGTAAAGGVAAQLGWWPFTLVLLAVVAVVALVVGAFVGLINIAQSLSDAYNADAIAAEKAAETARALGDAYTEAANKYQNMIDTMDQYTSARAALDSLTEGTQAYNDALAEANEAGLALINSTSGLKRGEDYRWENGELIIDQDAMDRIKQEESERVAQTRAASLMADANAATAKAKADRTAFVREDDMSGWAGLGLGAAAGAGYGAMFGPWGAAIGGVIGGIAGLGTALWGNSVDNKTQNDQIDKLAKQYETMGEEAFDDANLKALGFDTANKAYIDSLKEVVEATVAAADQTSNAARLAAQEILSTDEAYQRLDAEEKDRLGAASGRMYQTYQAEAEAKYLEQAQSRGWFNSGNAESKAVWEQYAELTGLNDLNGYKVENYAGNGDDARVEYSYIDEEGERQTREVTAQQIAAELAAAEAAERLGQSTEFLISEFNRLENSASKTDKALSDFLAGDMTQATKSEAEAMSDAFNGDHEIDTSQASTYLGSQFGGTDGILSDEEAKKYGYESAAAMAAAFQEEYNNTMRAWDSIALPSGIGEWGENLSLEAAQSLENTISKLNLGPMGEAAGEKFIAGLNTMLAGVKPEDQAAALNALMAIDWSDWDALSQADAILQQFGVDIDLTSQEWLDFAESMRIAARAVPDFSSLKSDLNSISKIINDLEFGDAIDEDDYQTLVEYNQEWSKFFVTQADGSRKFIGDAEAMAAATRDLALEHKNLLETYSAAAQNDNISSFDWDQEITSETLDQARSDFEALRSENGDILNPVLEALGYDEEAIQAALADPEKMKAMFDAIYEAIDPAYLDQIDAEFKEMFASTATSLEELQEMLSSGVIDDETYSKSLLAMASGYEYCSSAVQAYQDALASGDEAAIQLAEDNLEAAVLAEEAAAKLEGAYSHALSGKSSMTVEDLNLLKETNSELYDSFLTMSDDEWYEAAYQAQSDLLEERMAGYAQDSAEYRALMIEKQALDEEYYDHLRDKNQEAFDALQEQREAQIDAANSVMSQMQSSLTSSEPMSFTEIEELTQNLEAAGVEADRVKRIVDSIGAADNGSAEQVKAKMIAATEAALMAFGTQEVQKEEIEGVVTAHLANEEELIGEVRRALLSADGEVVTLTYVDSDGSLASMEAAVTTITTSPDGGVIIQYKNPDGSLGSMKASYDKITTTEDGVIIQYTNPDGSLGTMKVSYDAITATQNGVSIQYTNPDGSLGTMKLSYDAITATKNGISIQYTNPDGSLGSMSLSYDKITATKDGVAIQYIDKDGTLGTMEVSYDKITATPEGVLITYTDSEGNLATMKASYDAITVAPGTPIEIAYTDSEGNLATMEGQFESVTTAPDGAITLTYTDSEGKLATMKSNVDAITGNDLSGGYTLTVINDEVGDTIAEYDGSEIEVNLTIGKDSAINSMFSSRMSAVSDKMSGMDASVMSKAMKMAKNGYSTEHNADFYSADTWGYAHKYAALSLSQDLVNADNETIMAMADSGELGNFVRELLDQAVNSTSEDTREYAKMILMGLGAGLQDTDLDWGTFISGLGINISDAFKEELLIFSPSRLTKQLAPYLLEGLSVGISEGAANWQCPSLTGIGNKVFETFKAGLTPERLAQYAEDSLTFEINGENITMTGQELMLEDFDNVLKNFLLDQEYMDSELVTPIEKIFLASAEETVLATKGWTREQVRNNADLWNEYSILVQEEVNKQYQTYVNSSKQLWATIKDIWTTGVETILQKESDAAAKTVALWEEAFQAIARAREGLAEGKNIMEYMFDDPEAMAALVQSWMNDGMSYEDAMARLQDSNTTVDYEPWDAETYRQSGDQKYLNYNTATGQYEATTDAQMEENVRQTVAARVDEYSVEGLSTIFTSDYLQALSTTDDASQQAMVEELVKANILNRDTEGNLTLNTDKESWDENGLNILTGVIDKIVESIMAPYEGNQDAINGLLATAGVEQARQGYRMADQARQEGESYINQQQESVDLVSKARDAMLNGQNLSYALTPEEQAELLRITGEQDLTAISLDSLDSATITLTNTMTTCAQQIAMAMGMLQRGEATGFTIDPATGEVIMQGKTQEAIWADVDRELEGSGVTREGDRFYNSQGRDVTDTEEIQSIVTNAQTSVSGAPAANAGETIEAAASADQVEADNTRLQYAQAAGFESLEEQDEYIEYLTEVADKMQTLDEMTADGKMTTEEARKAQQKYANQLKKMEKAYERAIDEGDQYVEVLNDANSTAAEQSDAIDNLKQIYGDVLGPMEGVSAEFLKSADNMKLLQQAAQGDEEALNQLQVNYIDALSAMDIAADEHLNALATKVAGYDFGDLEIGASIDDTEFLNDCTALINSCATTADQASAMLSSLGVEAEVKEHTVEIPPNTEVKEVDGMVEIPQLDGSVQRVPAGGQITMSDTGGTYSYFTIEGAKYNGKGVTQGGGGNSHGRRGRGGGGGGGRRDPRRANHVKKEDYVERYHEIDNVIDDLADAYDRLNGQEDRAWGKDRIANMKEQAKVIEQQVAATEEKIRQAKEYLKLDKEAAEAAGWLFDENGNVMNYDEFMSGQVDKYNAAIDAYNKMSAEEQEKLDKKWSKKKNADGEYYSGYEDYLKQTLLDGPKDALDQYEETMELLEDLGMDYEDFLHAWHDNILGQIQTKLDTTLQISETQLEIIENKLSRIGDYAYSAAEAIALIGDQMNLAQANYNANLTAIDDLLKAYNGDWSVSGLLDGSVTPEMLADAGMEAGDIELILSAMSGMQDAQAQLDESMIQSFETMENAFNSFNDELERYVSTIEHAQTITNSYRNILDLTGRTMTGFNATMLKGINDAVVAQSKSKLSANKTKYESAQEQLAAAQEVYDQAVADHEAGILSDAAFAQAQATYNSAVDTANEAQEAFLSSWEEALQAAADAFVSNMEQAVHEVGGMLSGGLAGGLAELENQFAKLNERDQNYVDDYEKIYQLTKMTRDLESKIDSTSNVRAQKELLKYQKEINGLLESDQKMSEYDIDYLQKKIDLKMAEIAMDEAQNAKSQVTMRRDSEGNYNYVYTADEDAVARAESEYADKLYEMQVANDEYITTLSENMANLSSQMLDEIAAIDTTIYDTEEKYQAEVARITEHYSKQMEYYNGEMGKVLGNNKILYEQDWTNFSKYTGYKLSAEKDYVTDWNQTILSQVTGFETQEGFYANFNEAIFGDDPAHPSSDSLIGRLVTAYAAMRRQIDEANEAAGTTTGDLASQILGNISTATTQAQEAATGIQTAAGQISTAIGGMVDNIDEAMRTYCTAMSNMLNITDTLLESLVDFLALAGDIGDLDIDPGILSQIRARIEANRNQENNPEGYDTGGYTGAWGSEGRIAMLHQKELVLNADDTANMLASVGILRQIASVIDLNALASAGGFAQLLSAGVAGGRESLQQEVHIEAHFPNATDKNQIEDAFKDIVNLAAQYANRS